MQVSVDLRDEVDDLHGFVQTLKPEDWERVTGFMEWTPSQGALRRHRRGSHQPGDAPGALR
jgi:hypothetical protein